MDMDRDTYSFSHCLLWKLPKFWAAKRRNMKSNDVTNSQAMDRKMS